MPKSLISNPSKTAKWEPLLFLPHTLITGQDVYAR
jgi:hypothetical protein